MDFETCEDPTAAVRGGCVVHRCVGLDGPGGRNAKGIKDFAGYCIDEKLLANAPKYAMAALFAGRIVAWKFRWRR